MGGVILAYLLVLIFGAVSVAVVWQLILMPVFDLVYRLFRRD